jgi:hypothetical protein
MEDKVSKKNILIEQLKGAGMSDPVVKWIPRNPMGKKGGKVTGWVYREYEEKLWKKLGNNFEEAKFLTKEFKDNAS